MSAFETFSRRSLLSKLLQNPFAVAAIVVIGLCLVVSILAPFIAPFDPNAPDLSATHRMPFNGGHILGTDSIGRDVLSRLIWGGQITFTAAIVATSTALIAGVPTGLLAGYWSGIFDTVASWIMNLNLALPGIIIILAIRAAFGPNIYLMMAVLGVLVSPPMFRVTRSCVAAVRNENFVDAARVLGLSDWHIISRHIMFAVRAPIIIQAALVAGISILVQSGLEFLGLGDISRTSWGSMLNDGFRNVYVNPILMVWPSIAIAGVVALLAIFGNALRDALEEPTQLVQGSPAAAGRPPLPAAVSDLSDAGDGNILLSVRNLSVSYGRGEFGVRVVNGVSFDVKRGEVLGIVGESGSGKTQTAFAVLGLLPPEASVTADLMVFDGADLAGPGHLAAHCSLLGRRIAYVPQEPMNNLDPAFRIGSQLVRPMVKVGGMDRRQAKARALELLRMVGLSDPKRVYSSYPHQISGGMAQRVLIAGAISCEPDLLVADEPTTALDVTVQADILDLLRDLQSRMNMALIMVSHNMGVVADICDRVAVMEKARIVEVDATRNVLLSPQHPYTRQLIGALLGNKTPRTMLNSAHREAS